MFRTLYIISTIIWLLLSNKASSARKLPPFIKVCNRDAPNLNECVKQSMQKVRPHLPDGIRQMHIPQLEPLYVMHAAIDTGNSFKAIFDNIRIYGLTNFIVKGIDIDIDNTTFSLNLLFPLVRATADYEVNGRLLILRLNGHGKSEGKYANMETNVTISGKKFMKKGKEFAKFNDIGLDVRFGANNSLVFENIFRGNKELTDQTNKIISENIEGIMMEIKPVFDDTVAKITLGILKDVFNRYSLDELFPKKNH